MLYFFHNVTLKTVKNIFRNILVVILFFLSLSDFAAATVLCIAALLISSRDIPE